MSGPVVVIAGPTASGKSALAVQLALAFNGEIVSADSMQIYCGMDVGTAKPTAEERCGVPHHLLDIAEPGEEYSVSRYEQEGTACIRDILERGRLPIVCGGTGLYIDALFRAGGFRESGLPTGLRAELQAQWASDRAPLLEELRRVDPVSAAKLHPNDERRILRALEVYRQTGRTISEHNAYTQTLPPRFDGIFLALNFADRAVLYERIDRRVDQMLSQGLMQEVRALRDAGKLTGTAAQAIGYKELLSCLDGSESPDSAAEQLRRRTRNYAKRQLSWFRRDARYHWIVRASSNDDPLQESTQYLKAHGL